MPPFWVGFSKQRKKPSWRRSSNCVQNAFFQLFPSWPDKKNSREIKFYNFGFMPPFCVGFSKQRKKRSWGRSSNCVQNAFFKLSPSGRSEKTALGSNFTISVSCHHFGWAFPSSGKSRVDEGRPIAFKTRFFNFSHFGQTKKNSREIKFYNFGFMPPFCVGFSKQRKKPGWRRSSNCVQNAFFQLSLSGRNEKTALGSNFTISVSCHHFGWAFQGAEKAGFTKVVQSRSKRVLLNFPIGGKRKNSLGIEF